MTRLKALVTNPVEKSTEVRPFYALEHIESRCGRLAASSGIIERSDETAVLHRPGDVRFGKLRPYLAKSLYMTDHGHGSGELLVLRPRPSTADGRFIHYLTLSTPFVEWATATSYGVKMPRTSWESLASFIVAAPSIGEQQRIAEYLDAETAQIDPLVAELEGLVAMADERVWSLFQELVDEADAAPVSLRRVISRLSDGPFGSAFSSSDYSDSGAAVVRLGNIGFAEYREEDQAFVPLPLFESFSRHHVHAGDLLIAGLGDERHHAGRCCVAPDLGPAMVKGKCFVGSVDLDRASPHYLAYFLSAPLGRDAVGQAARGSTRAMINLDIARSTPVSLPPLAAQLAIVAAMGEARLAAREIADEVREQIALLQERRQALITHAVTKGLDGLRGVA